MSSQPKNAKQIFVEAIEQYPPDQWPDYLDQACGDDAQLRRRVEILLQAHVGDESLLDIPAMAPAPTIDQPITEGPGTVIGPYKLLQKIGGGGFGVVYMADQREPVKRRVALKIIKPGMDTRQVIARFEAERQALAMMDHPNIARVLDAGTTDSGRPYFVMELVKGVPITQFCDEKHLTPRERLELFVPVCQAVQHAHQKGVIHRDIKPTNVLVAKYDDRPVPKVIDFGVAKATEQRLTEKTMFTQLGQVIGTIDYMSPEQAELNQLDIDTRSDVYSLGVLLYELLTGETPFDRRRLRSAAFDELLRIIREEEPPRPSHRLSTSDALPSIAAITSIGTLDLDISITDDTHDDLSAVLISPIGTEETIATAPGSPLTSGTYGTTLFDEESLAGTWTLEITDSKNSSPHELTSWSLVAAASAPETASAVDAALLAWGEPDSSDDDDTDPLATQAADELALMLVE